MISRNIGSNLSKTILKYFLYIFSVVSFVIIIWNPKIEKDISLVITIKTTHKNHFTRIPQIIDSWYQLLPENIYFITDTFDSKLNQTLNGNLITTTCGSNHDPGSLGCKLNQEFMLMVKKNAEWSCHVDDDNYVNIPVLKELLKEFDSNIPYYLGRTAIHKPTEHNGKTIWFAIGGTAICFSNAALQKMAPIILNNELYLKYAEKDNMVDDMALGYVMNLLEINLTEIIDFMSQYDKIDLMPLKAIREVPVFSFREIDNTFVNLPYYFYPKDDPYKFQTLHCFLFPKQCNKNLERLKINVHIRKNYLNSYCTYVLPTVKA